jgi:hypothetical protein
MSRRKGEITTTNGTFGRQGPGLKNSEMVGSLADTLSVAQRRFTCAATTSSL